MLFDIAALYYVDRDYSERYINSEDQLLGFLTIPF